MRYLAYIMVIVIVFFSSMAMACKEAEAPLLPHPDDATEYEMLQAMAAVKQYVANQEVFLACVKSQRIHNQAVDRMHEVVNKYNNYARRYKALIESLDMVTELALVQSVELIP